MAGDPTNAMLWPDADVYVAPLATVLPADVDAVFPAGWEFVGLLDGDAGFTESRDEDTALHYAWGGLLVKKSRRQFQLTRTFTALEDNDVTRDLLWPGSTATELVVPQAVRRLVCFEVREGDKVHRAFSAHEVEIEVDGDITMSEADLTRLPFLCTFFPTAAGVLITEQHTA